MSAPPQRMDDLQPNADAPAVIDPVGIKQFIADRETSIGRIAIELLKEEERVSNCVEAIKDLELAISQRTATLEAHEQCLSALLLIQSRIKKQGLGEPVPTTRESRSGALQRVRVPRSSRIAIGSGAVDKEVEVAQSELQEIRCSIVELELELDGWRDLHELSTATVESLSSLKAKEEAILEKGRTKGRQRLMWMLPIDVWNKIFKLTMEAEVEAFHNDKYLKHFHLVIPTLSQVCRAWRRMVAVMPELTSYVPVPHYRAHDPNNDGFRHSISKAQAPITFLYRLSSNYRTRIWPPNVNDGQHNILEGRPYTLRLYADSVQRNFVQQIKGIPFKQPTSMVLVIPQSAEIDIFNSNATFETTTSLTFNNLPRYCTARQLCSTFPALTTLNLALQDIKYQVYLDELFLVSLKELHIRVKSGAANLCLNSRVNMANLNVLGITAPGGNLIQMIDATTLRTLVCYYPIGEIVYSWYSHSWPQLSRLELHDWNEQIHAVVLKSLVQSMPALKAVRLVGGRINGEELVQLMTELAPKKLELTLAYTSGITRDQCNKLKPLTSQLYIYV